MELSRAAIFVLFLQGALTEGKVCPSSINVVSNSSMEEQGGMYYSVRFGHYIELNCCSEEVVDVAHHWMKWNKDKEQWQKYDPSRNGVSFNDNRQTLSIHSSMFEDAGLYQCSVQNGSSVSKVINYHIDIVACDKLARGPYLIPPLPCQETLAREKETLTLPCTGYFGCGETGDIRIVTWFVSRDKNKQDDWVEATSVDDRYKQSDFQRDGDVAKGSNLTILAVSDVDFNRKFMCLVASPQEVHGQIKIFVTLKKDNSSVFSGFFTSVRILVVVSAVVVFSLVFNVVVSIITIHQRLKQSDKTDRGTSRQKWMSVESGNDEII